MVLRLANPLKTDSFFLFGARGVGKSTFIQQQFLKGISPEKIWHIDLLNDDMFDRYFTRPARIEDDLIAFAHKPDSFNLH